MHRMKTSTLFPLLALLSAGICAPPSLAFPPQLAQQETAANEKAERVRTVAVVCHPDFVEITVKADMFEIDAPIYPSELRLGAAYDHVCSAQASSHGEYKIVAGLSDCGTKHWVGVERLVCLFIL